MFRGIERLGCLLLHIFIRKESLKDPKPSCCLKGCLAAAVITSELKLASKLRVNCVLDDYSYPSSE